MFPALVSLSSSASWHYCFKIIMRGAFRLKKTARIDANLHNEKQYFLEDKQKKSGGVRHCLSVV
jgi:hypothetical protein